MAQGSREGKRGMGLAQSRVAASEAARASSSPMWMNTVSSGGSRRAARDAVATACCVLLSWDEAGAPRLGFFGVPAIFDEVIARILAAAR